MQSSTLIILGLVVVSVSASALPLPQYRAAIRNQLKALKSLECKPREKIISLRDLLEPTDILNHLDFFPTLAVVHRCDPGCGYCGDDEGKEDKVCKHVKTSLKEIVVTFPDPRTGKHEFERFLLENHDECGCQK